jgi:hypothetical protein
LVIYNQAADRQDRAAALNARNPDPDEAMMDAGPLELEAMMNALSLSNDNWVDDSAWQYYAEKYKAESAPSGRTSSNTWQTEKRIVRGPSRIRTACGIICYGAEDERVLTKNTFTTSCGQDFRRRGGGDGVPFTASPAVGIKNLYVM